MRRREFIAAMGGAATWPLVARAQQAERVRRIGMLLTLSADDPETMAGVAAFRQELQQSGWGEGRWVECEMAGATKGDRAERGSRGGSPRSRHILRHRPMGCHPNCGAVIRSRSEPNQRARQE